MQTIIVEFVTNSTNWLLFLVASISFIRLKYILNTSISESRCVKKTSTINDVI